MLEVMLRYVKWYRDALKEEREMESNYLMSVEQFAEKLGLSVWTIRRYISDGRIAAVRIGRRVLVESSEAERLIAEGRLAAQAVFANRAVSASAAR